MGWNKIKMQFVSSVFLVFVSVAVTMENCDKMGILIYEDMNCKPLNGKPNLCPLKYDCKGLQKSNTTCYLKGKSYKIDQPVSSDITAAGCDLGCFCERNQGKMSFFCARLDCPEWKGPPKAGCYRKYSLDACCSIRETCPPFDNSTTCLYDGKVYKEGENFLPKDSCWRCVCQPGFRGRIEEPFCRRRICGVQVKHQDKVQKACAPIYYKRPYREDQILCCPNSWICPKGDERITGKPISGASCKFGKRYLKVGEGFSKNVTEVSKLRPVKCECKVPPLLTCTTEVI